MSIVRKQLKDIPRMSKKRAEYLAQLGDETIDYSDIPAITDDDEFELIEDPAQLLELPSKANKLISIRLRTEVTQALKEEARAKGIGYQTLINQILYTYVRSTYKP